MKICGGCRRHLMAPEPQCPFCGEALPTVASTLQRCGRAVMVGVSMMLGSMGCDPGSVLETGEPPMQTGTSTGETGSSSVTTDPSSEDTFGGSGMVSATEGSDGVDSSDGPDNSDDGGGSFYAGVPDGFGSDFECDIFAQDCPEGEKCMPWANDGGGNWNATRCSPIADNPDQVGEPCTVEGSGASGLDSCDAGSMCWEVDSETNEGHCEDFCMGNEARPICEDPDDACSIANDGAIVLCLSTCDPVLQDCDDGQGCFPVQEHFVCVVSHEPETAPGDPCSYINGCAPGQACVAGDAVAGCGGELGCCTSYCDVTAPEANADCATEAMEHECLAWFEEGEAPLDWEHVGICAIPTA